MRVPVVVTLCGLVLASSVGCSGIMANMSPEAHALAPNVTVVVGRPPLLEFKQSGEQGRVARRFGDTLLAATGGRAFIPEELNDAEGPAVAAALRAIGAGDLDRAVTFRVVATRVQRKEATPSALPGIRQAVYAAYDYMVRLEVGRPGADKVIGTVETWAAASPDDLEVSADGETTGLQTAVDDAVVDAVARFAPALRPTEPAPRLMEVPPDPGGKGFSTGERLNLLAMLYPEQPADVLHRLAASEAQFLVLSAGTLRRVGIEAGDLLGASRGPPLGGRAALARKLAAGVVPPMYAERGSDRFLIAETKLGAATASP